MPVRIAIGRSGPATVAPGLRPDPSGRPVRVDLAQTGIARGEPILLDVGTMPVKTWPVLPGYLRLTVPPRDSSLDVLMTAPPRLVGGGPRWGRAERDGRVSLTPYEGADPHVQEIDVILDGTRRSVSVERAWQHLRGLWRPAAGAQPPRLAVAGVGVHLPNLRWHLVDLRPGEEEGQDVAWARRRGSRQREVLRRATLTLEQHVIASPADRFRPARGAAAGKRPRREKAKPGETLATFAKRVLGDARRWDDVARANRLKGARRDKVVGGQTLTVPT